MIKRWLITFAVAWLLGCVVTVLVAWCCTVQLAPTAEGHLPRPSWPAAAPPDWPDTYYTFKFANERWPRGAAIYFSAAYPNPPEYFEMKSVHAGWPMLAMSSTERKYRAARDDRWGEIGVVTTTTGWRAPVSIAPSPFAYVPSTFQFALPTTPRPLAFIVNTTVAAASLCAIFALYRAGTVKDPRHRRRFGRVFGLVVGFLAIGATLSFAVAIGTWFHWQQRGNPTSSIAAPDDLSLSWSRDWFGRASDTANRWPAAPPLDWTESPSSWGAIGRAPGVFVSEYESSGRDLLDQSYPMSCIVTRIGWPMHCLDGFEFVEGFRNVQRTPGPKSLDVSRLAPSKSPGRFGSVLPLGPIWLGLLANTLFYAYVIAMPVLSIRAARVVRRRRRGACESCGYSRAGLDASTPCPECGTAVQARRTS